MLVASTYNSLRFLRLRVFFPADPDGVSCRNCVRHPIIELVQHFFHYVQGQNVVNKGIGNVYKRKTHRIWTGGAAPSSNPVSFSFVHISKALIHTVQNAYFSQKCCTYWEPDTPGSQSHPHSALCLSNRTIQLVSMSVGPRLIVALSLFS